MSQTTADDVLLTAGQDWGDLRTAIARLCGGFPNDYLHLLDKENEYPHAFVKTLTDEGFLGALIPEEFGGSGLPLRPV